MIFSISQLLRKNTRLLVVYIFTSILISACSNIPVEQAGNAQIKHVISKPDHQAANFVSIKNKPNAIINIMAVGDIMLGTDYPDYRLAPNDGKDLLSNVASILSKADITFGNLEGTFGTAGTAEKSCPDVTRCYVFRMPPHYAQYLKDSGFDVLSLANNHARDFGDSGRLLTMATLDQYGIQHSGLMGDIASWQIKGLKIVLIAFAPFRDSHDFLDFDYVQKTISKYSSLYDIVIVSFHAGAEGDTFSHVPFETEYFHGENRGDVARFAHIAIDAGADILLGHGPHVPRALELYQGKIIAYSLGNFCTTLGIKVSGKNGLAPILSVNVDKNGDFKSGKIISARQLRPSGPVLDSKHQAARMVKQLTEQDFPTTSLEIDAIGNIKLKPTKNPKNSETKSDKEGPDSVK